MYVWGKSLPLLLFLLHFHCLLFERWKNTITRYIFFLLVPLLDTKCQMKSICVRCFGEEHHVHGGSFHLNLFFFCPKACCQYNFARREQERCAVPARESGKYSHGLRRIAVGCQEEEVGIKVGKGEERARRTGTVVGREED